MLLKSWDDLPACMKNEFVRKHHKSLSKKQHHIILKRLFDVFFAAFLLVALLPLFVVITIIIKTSTNGPVLFKQLRFTQYCNQFWILKFRTMTQSANRFGSSLTVHDDTRVTKIGKILRKLKLDETPQLLNVITGDMSFVGSRPEIAKYIHSYSEEMMATFLLPAGITSEASIAFKDEEDLLVTETDLDSFYVNKILPEKMKLNLKSLDEFSFWNDILIILHTVLIVFYDETTRWTKRLHRKDLN